MTVKDWLQENKRLLYEPNAIVVSVYYDYTVDDEPAFETNISVFALEKLFGHYALFKITAYGDLLMLTISRFYSKPQEVW